MKQKLWHFIRVICLIAGLVLAVIGFMYLGDLHREAFPRFYGAGRERSILPGLLAGMLFLLTPLAVAGAGRLCKHRVTQSCIAFVHIVWGKGIRLGRPCFGTAMLPPRLDGASPFVLPMLSTSLYSLCLSGLFLLLSLLLWKTAEVETLLFIALFFFVLALTQCLPRANGTDVLSRVWRMRRSPDLVRAWECATHINDALADGKTLPDMPDAWFQTYPAELAEDVYVSNCMINGSSRLIRRERYGEAYEMLRPLFNLKPAPHTHRVIACAVLNGAVCEVMNDLPPMCLEQLDHHSVKYMTPSNWQPRMELARYARALLHHNEDEAAEILSGLEKLLEQNDADRTTLIRLQRKTGVTPQAGGDTP